VNTRFMLAHPGKVASGKLLRGKPPFANPARGLSQAEQCDVFRAILHT
jgi:hypothetical protein